MVMDHNFQIKNTFLIPSSTAIIIRFCVSSVLKCPSTASSSTFNFVKVIRRQMLNHNILMTYKGDFSQNSILPILKMIEDNHFTKESELRLQKRIFIVLVEMLQNISKHAVEELTNQGIFLIGIDKEDKYFISTGNLIKKHNVEQLESHLNQVNNLDQSQLNLLYRQTLRNGKLSDSGGAGLGIIDMARESSNKLEFKFEKMASAAEILSKRNMKALNLIAIAIVIIAWLIRFYYFTKREHIVENEDGTVT